MTKLLNLFNICLAGSLLFMILPSTAVAAPSVSTHAEAAALIDVSSGRILYSHNGDKKMRIASITKIMTAIVAIEAGSLSDKVKVSSKSYGIEGSSLYLRLGEEMNLHHMLYGLMLRSGNDAAAAIAEHIGGSIEGFVKMMNDKAEWLGLSNTQFKNPHGLDAEGHYSSANDMAKLAAYALHNPVFRDIVKTPSISVPNPYEKWDHRWRNKNKMLYLYEGADGVKTGYTKLSKRTLVSSATRSGQQLAAVTLNDGDDWTDHARMFDFGFKYYPSQVIHKSGQPLAGTSFVSPTTFTYPLEENERPRTEVKLIPVDSLSGRLGLKAIAYYYLDEQLIGKQLFYDKANSALMNKKNSKVRPTSQFAQVDTVIQDDVFYMMGRLFRGLFTTKQ
jgi:D-alanyl-D-alanine carboxypeptidase (penicillin-binding protein 5/6)